MINAAGAMVGCWARARRGFDDALKALPAKSRSADVASQQENRLNPFAYLCHLFEQMPNVDLQNPAAVKALLPCSDSLPSICKASR